MNVIVNTSSKMYIKIPTGALTRESINEFMPSPSKPPPDGRLPCFVIISPQIPLHHTTTSGDAIFTLSDNRLPSARNVSTAMKNATIGTTYTAQPIISCSVRCSQSSTGPPAPNHDTTISTAHAINSTAAACCQYPSGNSCCGAALRRVAARLVDFLFAILSYITPLAPSPPHYHCTADTTTSTRSNSKHICTGACKRSSYITDNFARIRHYWTTNC